MMWLVVFLMILGIAFGDCPMCDSSCGNWSCITNCPSSDFVENINPTFDTYRCAVDSNYNGQVDDCSELLVCQWMNGKYVCPADLGDSLCTSADWQGPYPYDSDPNDSDAPIWGVYLTSSSVSFSQYQSLLSQYSLECPSPPYSIWDRFYQSWGLPLWVCGGALYYDAWLSYSDCSYISYDGFLWKVKNDACFDPNKIWQKLSPKCYGTEWSHTIYFSQDDVYAYLYWSVPVPQDTFNQTQSVYVNNRTYSVNMRCVSSTTVVDELSGALLVLCTTFLESVYDSNGSLLYNLYWYQNSSWDCPVYWSSQSSPYTTEYLSPSSSGQFYGVMLERPNNTVMRGIGIDRQGSRCRICSTNLYGLSGGVVKRHDVPDTTRDFEKLGVCVNPRFFGGESRSCRPGGLTTLGATCCGLSGWTKNMCNIRERELKKKRQAGLCHEVGTYCSKRVLGICLERKRSFCCFNSSLARILQECGRPQIGKGWGSPKRPDCSGYTIDEFVSIDFTSESCVQAIEEWARGIAQSVGDSIVQDIASRVNDRVQWWINNVKNTKDYGGEK